LRLFGNPPGVRFSGAWYKLIEGFVRTLEASELEERLARLEERT